MLAFVRRAGVPEPAALLGAAGLLPFLAGVLGSFHPDEVGAWARSALLSYGAVILSFLGGVHWGLAMAASRPSFLRYGASTVPALLAWLALLLGGRPGFVVLAASFASLLAFDIAAARNGETPAWYPALRWPLTVAVCLALVLALFTF
ncbi:MAG: DUF3429 domain-containing protein [Geminicoccaceae bacterium]|nr:DUF3429 domain-containing protein [Geminicoccaceae bacterium]MCS7267388.1 DUF3429 domain-containing protein [Geminicoccaceae bacterium]MCX7629511.1 DUF3429 domain-containing protein [Geminicoccaceae bacterium]MDW8123611.1 DUF3429 domain-containing protein [Geminicoccaceae bacterium]MDW8339952.1 DUF3429 domain-containing protein [Geminicoccaceae bacterium]